MLELKVGLGSCGAAAGGRDVMARLQELLPEEKRDRVRVVETGCIGLCHREVLVEVVDEQGQSVLYGDVTPERVEKILDGHMNGGQVEQEWVVDLDRALDKQVRIVLRNCGIVDPSSLEDYRARDGFQGMEKAITSMTPEEVIEEITASGLRGRGGAGFPTGMKWSFARKAKGSPKYVVCNADEGDPGAFMDRSVLEGDPFSVLEGMVIAAYAMGAEMGWIYARAEYPLAIRRLEHAIAAMEEERLLGKNLFGTDFHFEIKLKQGAGAFVCGEETALLYSIEGRRGTPRIRPPFPVEKGLWDRPTCINNVETFANVPWIIQHGAAAYAEHGTQDSKGTKVFALAGKVRNGGLVEIPMGLSVDELIEEIGGGTESGETYKAVQIGGPSGGCIPKKLGKTSIDYQQITATGAIMGSGGVVIMDQSTCMVDVARFFLSFTQSESCGKCTFCRLGTKRMLEVLQRICAGEGQPSDIGLLKELGEQIKEASLCGLGQSAPNPVLTSIRHFEDEFRAHIEEHRCPAKVCLALVEFVIDPEKCNGCGLCLKSCDAGAITGEKRKPHVIDISLCVRCGKCLNACAREAIEKR